jgi:hypothetical protein
MINEKELFDIVKADPDVMIQKVFNEEFFGLI